MRTQFSLDLRLARRRSGFTQRDIAHLLAAHQSAISDLERGRVRPTLTQIVTLSLIYGRSFESLFSEVMTQARQDLVTQLDTLPKARVFIGTTNRANSIARLRRDLAALMIDHGSA